MCVVWLFSSLEHSARVALSRLQKLHYYSAGFYLLRDFAQLFVICEIMIFIGREFHLANI
jgi:hypothetical protein